MPSTRFFHHGPCQPPTGPAATALGVGTAVAVLGLVAALVAAPVLGPGQSWVLWLAGAVALVFLATHAALALAHLVGLPVPAILHRRPAPTATTGDAEAARNEKDRGA